MLVRFMILSFGFVFAHRMIEFQINRKPLSEATSKKVAQFQILFFWLATILSPWIPVLFLVFFIFVPNLAAARLDWILNFVLRQKFQQNLLSFIDEIILLMMTGKSFRDSFLYLTANPKDFFQFKMRELLIAGSFQDKTRFTKRNEMIQITELVQAIEKNPHKSIDRLRAFRRQLHWVQSFERKSKQATTQIRAQALVLTLLYCGLLGFVMKNSNASTTPIIFPSVFLFLLGLVALYLLSRRTKWKT
jgi:hypothetical protein